LQVQNNKLLLIGDVHAKFAEYQAHISEYGNSLQLGDFGVGFLGHSYPELLPGGHSFIRGNHDNPLVARVHPNYQGDYGIRPDDGIFYLSGAHTPSFDSRWRIAGVDWWPDEQLSQEDLNKALIQYVREKPEIMVSHCCPFTIQQAFWHFNPAYPNRTCDMLDLMLKEHQPKLWVFGHYHKPIVKRKGKTKFVCLGELDTMEVEV
jgi:predicted phosphohydrolase